MSAPEASTRRWLVALGALAVLGWLLVQLGSGPLASPPTTPAALPAWVDQAGPIAAALAIFRLVLLAITAYLLLTLALFGLARVAPAAVGSVLDRTVVAVTPVVVQRLLRAACGLAVVTALGAGPIGAAGATPPTASGTSTGTATLVEVDPSPGPGTAVLSAVPTDDPQLTPPPTPPPAPAQRPPTSHRVVPGDHLWSIASAQVSSHLGRPASDAEIGRYWVEVIGANPHIADPDVIHPGDEVVLPPLPR